MKPETLEALKGSIRKWSAILDGSGQDKGAMNCALCARFLDVVGTKNDCETRDGERCPVFIRSGYRYCRNTPYTKWLQSQPSEDCVFNANTPKRKAAAKAEIEFLRSLLPEGK